MKIIIYNNNLSKIIYIGMFQLRYHWICLEIPQLYFCKMSENVMPYRDKLYLHSTQPIFYLLMVYFNPSLLNNFPFASSLYGPFL